MAVAHTVRMARIQHHFEAMVEAMAFGIYVGKRFVPRVSEFGGAKLDIATIHSMRAKVLPGFLGWCGTDEFRVTIPRLPIGSIETR